MCHDDDADILTAKGLRFDSALVGTFAFEQATQDGRRYYRLLLDGRGGGSLTDAIHARATIEYWREKGWLLPLKSTT